MIPLSSGLFILASILLFLAMYESKIPPRKKIVILAAALFLFSLGVKKAIDFHAQPPLPKTQLTPTALPFPAQ